MGVAYLGEKIFLQEALWTRVSLLVARLTEKRRRNSG